MKEEPIKPKLGTEKEIIPPMAPPMIEPTNIPQDQFHLFVIEYEITSLTVQAVAPMHAPIRAAIPNPIKNEVRTKTTKSTSKKSKEKNNRQTKIENTKSESRKKRKKNPVKIQKSI